MTVQIRKSISIEEVYKQAKKEKSAAVRVRLLGIAAVLEGEKREYAAKIAGLTINNIRIWIKRFNERGFDGLVNKKQLGRESKWNPVIEEYLKNKITTGACFEKNKRVSYRLKDLQADLKKEFNVLFGISTIWYKLKDLEFSWISVRQKHPKSDQLAQEKFKKKLQTRLKKFKKNTQQKK